MAYIDNLCGLELGDYRLVAKVGEGTFGAVYRSQQRNPRRAAIVKVLHPRLSANNIALQRFLREAQVASSFRHSYAAHIYAFGVERDRDLFWIAMELVEGVPLDAWLRERGPMPLDQFVPFFKRVAEVVQAAHEAGIIHRDLKPSNIMVTTTAGGKLSPKLLDFGIAKLLQQLEIPIADLDVTQDGSSASTLTADGRPLTHDAEWQRLTYPGAMVGTPAYMPKEQWNDPGSVGPQSDLYALAVVAYEVLTERRPFPGPTTAEYADQHSSARVPPVGDGLPAALDAFFSRALAKRPEQRWGSATELAAALRSAADMKLRSALPYQLRTSALQWEARSRHPGLLWRGPMLREANTWAGRPSTSVSELETSFLVASRRADQRTTWIRCLVGSLVAAVVLALLALNAVRQAHYARDVAEAAVTQAETEQGRQAQLHGDLLDAREHLTTAYERGDHRATTRFMLARAQEPFSREVARVSATSGIAWSATFSPDGTRVVTTDDASVKVWDAKTTQLIYTLRHSDTVYQAIYDRTGSLLFTAGGDGAVRIWDAATGAPVRVLTGNPRERYYALALSPDARLVAAIDLPGKVARVWDARTGAAVAELQNDGAQSPTIAFSADSQWLATGGGDDVRVFETSTWERIATIAGPGIRSFAFDPTGPRLATASAGGDASIWALPEGVRAHHLREVGEPIESIAYSPHGEYVAAGGRDGSLQVWSATAGTFFGQNNSARGKIVAIEFSADSRKVLTAGAGGAVVVSDVLEGLPLIVLAGPESVVRVAHFDPEARRVVGAAWDGKVRVWDISEKYRQWNASAVSNDCYTKIVPDERYAIVGCFGHGTRVWDTAHDQLIAELPAVDGKEVPVTITSDGRLVAMARGNLIDLYDVTTGKLSRTVNQGTAVTALSFGESDHDLVSGAVDGSVLFTREGAAPEALPKAAGAIDVVGLLPDGRAISADASKQLRLMSSSRQEVVAAAELAARARSLRLSPRSDRLISIPTYNGVTSPPTLWEISPSGFVRIGDLVGHAGHVFSASFAADGDLLTAGADGTARLWGASGHLRRTFRGSSRFLADARLDPSSTMVVAAGGDGIVRFWDRRDGRLLWTLPAHRLPVVAFHFEREELVTRDLGGGIAHWKLAKSETVIESCLPRAASKFAD